MSLFIRIGTDIINLAHVRSITYRFEEEQHLIKINYSIADGTHWDAWDFPSELEAMQILETIERKLT